MFATLKFDGLGLDADIYCILSSTSLVIFNPVCSTEGLSRPAVYVLL